MNVPPTKFAIFGDIHANLEALNAVLQDAQAQGCTHYACVGDLVGYNANPRECVARIRELNIPCVKGNHDEFAASDRPLERWSARAATALLWTRQQLSDDDRQWLRSLHYVRNVGTFSIVHATLDAPDRWGYVLDRLGAAGSFLFQTTSVCFFGHTHVPLTFTRDLTIGGGTYSSFRIEAGRQYFINVGSVGEPRDGTPMASYVTYTQPEGLIELHRVAFDADQTEAKLLAQGLPLRKRRVA